MDPGELLTSPERELWFGYCECERDGRRKQGLALLGQFIEKMRGRPPTVVSHWVETFCRWHWDDAPRGDPWCVDHVRAPLVTDLILPELLHGYDQRYAARARWLALFFIVDYGLVYRWLSQRGRAELEPERLLREALALDPADARAAAALRGALARRFNFFVHEVPYEVLMDDTPAWRAELDEFERLVDAYPTTPDHSSDIRYWRYHCDAWEEYLRREDERESYAEFLARRRSWRRPASPR